MSRISYTSSIISFPWTPYPILSETPGSVRTLWPTIGQHNEEIYHELLGFPLETPDALKAEGII